MLNKLKWAFGIACGKPLAAEGLAVFPSSGLASFTPLFEVFFLSSLSSRQWLLPRC